MLARRACQTLIPFQDRQMPCCAFAVRGIKQNPFCIGYLLLSQARFSKKEHQCKWKAKSAVWHQMVALYLNSLWIGIGIRYLQVWVLPPGNSRRFWSKYVFARATSGPPHSDALFFFRAYTLRVRPIFVASARRRPPGAGFQATERIG